MEILTFPIGLLIGLFPVLVDLGNLPGNARLLLDGNPVCEVSARAPGCMVDLGPAPRVHTLDLERRDEHGRVVESIRRWVNRPGIEGKIRAVGSCDDRRRECTFQIQWAHPAKLDPVTVTVGLDGKTVTGPPETEVKVPFPGKFPPRVLTVEATFADGSRASFTNLLAGFYPEEARASLRHDAIEILPGEAEGDLPARLRETGWKVRAVEEGDAEIVFVVEPRALERHPELIRARLTASLRGSPFDESWDLVTVGAEASLPLVRAYSKRGWSEKATTTGAAGRSARSRKAVPPGSRPQPARGAHLGFGARGNLTHPDRRRGRGRGIPSRQPAAETARRPRARRRRVRAGPSGREHVYAGAGPGLSRRGAGSSDRLEDGRRGVRGLAGRRADPVGRRSRPERGLRQAPHRSGAHRVAGGDRRRGSSSASPRRPGDRGPERCVGAARDAGGRASRGGFEDPVAP